MSDPVPVTPSRSDFDWCGFLRREGPSGETLERALHSIGVLQPGGWANWTSDNLTLTGSPVLLEAVSGQPKLSLLTEVDDPQCPPHQRMIAARRLMAAFGATLPPASFSEIIAAAQSSGDLAYGALLGLSCHGRDMATKMIVEVPRSATDLVHLLGSGLFFDLLADLGQAVVPTRASYHGVTRAVSVRFDTTLSPDIFVPLVVAGSGMSASSLTEPLRQLAVSMGYESWPKVTYSFSYTYGSFGVPPRISVHMPTATLAATDAGLAQHIIGMADADLPGYAALLNSMAPAANGGLHHTEVGYVARKGRKARLLVRLAAPWGSAVADQVTL